MSKFRGIAAAAALAAVLPLLMAPSGGFPSRPTFQAVTVVGNATGASCGAGGGTALCVKGFQNAASLIVDGSSTTGQSLGLATLAGTNSSDYSLLVMNQAGTSTYLKVDGAGNITTPNAASTPWNVTGTYTATLSTGCTTTPTATAKWARAGSIVTIAFGSFGTCTSNSTLRSLDASVPAGERPSSTQDVVIGYAEDNGAKVPAVCARVQTSGVIDFDTGGTTGGSCAGANWTSSGTTGFGSGFTITYQTAN